MKLALFQELLDLNRAFEQVMQGLLRLERVRAFNTEQIRGARAEVETARVDVNREFFDSFGEMVEDEASWAYKFQREYKQKTKDLNDVYFDIKEAEERRKKKGLPPRVAILRVKIGTPVSRARSAASRRRGSVARSLPIMCAATGAGSA